MAEMEEMGVASSSHWPLKRKLTSIVEDQGVYSSSCGYCKASKRTSVAQGLWAHTLTVYDYQGLLDRGWRRSGMFVYKPNMQQTCCPPYTIRLRASEFVPSKDQTRVLRRMQRYMEGTYQGPQAVGKLPRDGRIPASESFDDVLSNSMQATPSESQTSARGEPGLENGKPCCTLMENKTTAVEAVAVRELTASIKCAIANCIDSGSLPQGLDIPKVVVHKVTDKARRKLKDIGGKLEYTTSVAFSITAAAKRKQSPAWMGVNIDSDSEVNGLKAHLTREDVSPDLVSKSLVSKLQESGSICGLTAQACKGHLNFLTVGCTALSTSPGSGTSPTVPASVPASVSYSGECRSLPLQEIGKRKRGVKVASISSSAIKPQQLDVEMKRSTFDAEEFALYRKYQMIVHNDRPEEVKESSYRRFLVDTPLVFVPPENDGSTPVCGFGSFHQQYRINGKLVAVGVVDILPNCLSSKYLFWDPDLAFLSLGKYSALKEIEWVQEANKVCPVLAYYYLGFYIHSCPKMQYKAAYVPSELLCPVRFTWVPYHLARPILDITQYACLSDAATAEALSLPIPTERKLEEGNGGEPGSVDEVDEEMTSTASEARDAECYVGLEGREHREDRGDLPSPQIPEHDVLEDNMDESKNLRQIVLLLNNRCLSFKRLEESGVVPQRHMQALIEQLGIYLQGVGPTLAARMALTLT